MSDHTPDPNQPLQTAEPPEELEATEPAAVEPPEQSPTEAMQQAFAQAMADRSGEPEAAEPAGTEIGQEPEIPSGAAHSADEDGGEGSASLAPTTDYADLNTYAESLYGKRLTATEAEGLFNAVRIAQDFAALSEDQRQAIQRVLDGSPAGSTGEPSQPRIQAPEDDDYAKQILGHVTPAFDEQAQRLAAIEEQIARQAQANQSRTQQENTAVIDRVSGEWRGQHQDLTDEEHTALHRRVVESGIFPVLVQQHKGDIAAATAAAYDHLYWTTPEFRQRHLDQQLATERAREKTDSARRSRAASVAGGGGAPVSRTEQPEVAPNDRKAAITQAFTQAMQERQAG